MLVTVCICACSVIYVNYWSKANDLHQSKQKERIQQYKRENYKDQVTVQSNGINNFSHHAFLLKPSTMSIVWNC